MKKILLLLSIISTQSLFSQEEDYEENKNSNQVKVDVVLDDPQLFPGTSVYGGLDIMNRDAGITYGGMLGIRKDFTKNMQAFIDVSYGRNRIRQDNHSYFQIEPRIEYFFKSNSKETNSRIIIGGDGFTRTYLKVKLNETIRYGARVGANIYQADFFRNREDINAYSNSFAVFIGLVRNKRQYAQFKTDKFGEVSKSLDGRIYFDILIPVTNDAAYEVLNNPQRAPEYINLGYRVGFTLGSYSAFSKKLNIAPEIALGQMPGMANSPARDFEYFFQVKSIIQFDFGKPVKH